MASEVTTTYRWSDKAVGAILAERVRSNVLTLANVPWTFRVSPDGWMELSFADDASDSVERLGPSLGARLVMHAIEQSEMLQRLGIVAAQAKGEEFLKSMKQEIGL